MSKKIILFFIGIIFFFGFRFVFAGLVINEIMYAPVQSDSYNEWIELYNSGSDSVDLSNLLICGKEIVSGYIKHSDGSLNIDNGLTLSAGGFALITDGGSGTDVYTNFSVNSSALAIHTASFSEICSGLSNSGKTITLSGPSSDSVIYASSQGANGDGNSLQKISDSWVSAISTPGATNEIVTTPSPSSSGSSNVNGAGTGPFISDEIKSKIIEPKEIKTKITTQTFAFVGFPTYFQATSYGHSGEELYYGRYFWNFGDGDFQEVKLNNLQQFTHTYFYPGEYLVSLEYYMDNYKNLPDATDKIIFKVVPADIVISSVGDEKDFFIELTNNANYDTNISKWILVGNNKSFVFPKNTIIGSEKKMIISPKITNFSFTDKNNLKLLNPQGEIVFDYPIFISSTVLTKTVVQPSMPVSQSSTMTKPLGDALEEKIPVENLLASVAQSDIVKNDSDNLFTTIIYLISFVFIGISAGAVYFLRQKKIISGVGSDFEILDE